MKPKNILIVLFISLIASAVILYFINKSNNKNDNNLPTDTSDKPTGTTVADWAETLKQSGYPVVYGKKSEAAKQLQLALGFEASQVDGIIGSYTLRVWQYYHNTATKNFKIANPTQLANEIEYINAQRLIKTY